MALMGIRGVNSGGGASTLDSLTDVIITTPSLGDILQYDGVDWVNVASGSDWLSQYLLLAGRTGGQVIGSGAHTGGASTDLALEGRLLLGDNLSGINYVANRAVDLRQLTKNNTTQINIQYSATGFTGTASGNWRGLQLVCSGTAGWTAGTAAQVLGFFFTMSLALPSGVTVTEGLGGLFQATPQESNSGTAGWNNITGLRATALGPTVANAGHTAAKISGMNADVSNRNKITTSLFGFEYTQNTGSTANLAKSIFFGMQSQYTVGNGVTTNLYGLLLDPTFVVTGTLTNKYGFWISDAFTKSVLGHSLTVGATADPIHTLDSQGNLGVKVATKAAVYAANLETVILCNANAGAFALNLPTAVGISGRIYIIKKTDASANAVTVTPNGAETIDGAATVVLNAQYQVTRIISDNANWMVI